SPGRAATPVVSSWSRLPSPGRGAAEVGSPRSRSARRPAGRGERVGWVWGGVAAGTALGAGLDRAVGGLDGKPALFLLVIFTLPFWDRLPARLPARLATLAGLLVAVAAAWLAIAPARPEAWWRGELSFGLACAIVGTVHALATAGRTVEP
ncbi:MAG TPA: hypothetical protein VI357_26990, partial [Mycobacteriales bacterium]